MKKIPSLFLIVVVVAGMLAGCGTPETVEVEKVVTEVVEVEKEVTRVVEEQVEVTRVVQEEVEVEVTAVPEAKGGKIVLTGTKAGSRLDPHLDSDWEVLYILSAIYDTLVYEDQDGNYVPGLATEWTVSDDGTSYTFTLRDDVTFHDGTPFNADAVKYNFDRIALLSATSEKAGSLITNVESVEVVDDTTVAITLAQSDGFFLNALSLPYLSMVSPAAVEEWGNEEYHLHQIGTGPFMFSEYNPEDHYTLVPNPNYNWAPSIFGHQGPAYLEEITWRFLPEPATRAPALESGDADIVVDLLPTDATRLMNSPDFHVSTAYLTGQPALWFLNTSLAPTDDINVRKAIIYAADIQGSVIAIKRGLNPVAHGPLASNTLEYAPELDDMYSYDPEMAMTLLDEAGWVDSDGDGIRDKDGQPLVVQMAMQGWGQSQPFSEILQGQLRDVGIDLELEMLNFPGQMEAASQNTKNIYFMGGSGFTAADSLRGYFHSENVDGGFAWSKYSDPELDAMIENGNGAVDPAERMEYFREAQVRIMEQALVLPIYDYAVLIGVNNRVQGLTWRSVGLVPSVYDMYVED